MTDSLVSIYVRSEGYYLTSSGRTTIGLWMESDEWEFVPRGSASALGSAVVRRLSKASPILRHPERDEFSSLRAQTVAPLLKLAGVRTWKSFIANATLVHVEGMTPVVVMPMRRDGRRVDAFVPVPEARQELSNFDDASMGEAVTTAERLSGGA
jgi:hypothetical protein